MKYPLNRPMRCLAAIAALACALSTRASEPSPEAVEFFETKVRPVLADRCFKCHGEETQKAGLRLDSRATMLTGGEGGPVLMEGDQAPGSRILQVINYDMSTKMPPDAKLPQEQIDAITAWVKMGSPWPGGGEVVATNKATAWADRVAAARATQWSFQPVKLPAAPEVTAKDWARTPIDQFILARLESKQLAPSPRADKRTLIRRAYIDLTGLAPSNDAVRAFEADESADSFDKVIEQLLASPRYGERWGRHWLDVARYADTKGYVFQEERSFGFSHTYRDYVVRAFNDDLPYNTFVKQQLAADQMDLGEDKRPLAALGYLTLGRRFVGNIHDVTDDRIDVVMRGMQGLTVSCARCHDHKFDAISSADYYGLYGIFRSSTEPAELPLIQEPDPKDPKYQEFLAELNRKQSDKETLLDQIQSDLLTHCRDKIGAYLMAASKAWEMDDPSLRILAKDYGVKWQLVTRWRDHLKTLSANPHPVLGAWFAYRALPDAEFASRSPELTAQIAAKQLNGQEVNPRIASRFEGEAPKTMDEVTQRYADAIQEAAKAWSDLLASRQQIATGQPERAPDMPQSLPDLNLEAVRQLVFGKDSPANIPRSDVFSLSEVPTQNRMREKDNAITRVKNTHPGRPDRAMALVDGELFNPYVFRRGQPGNRGDDVPRKFLDVLSTPGSPPFAHGSGRLDLANAIASNDNPLTARVMVNRIWLQHFGLPLVGTPSDFGARSDAPTHPELLDYLASEFMAGNWSVKNIHRMIMRSAVYQQQSAARPEGIAADPENHLLWRQNRQRLDFESMRDGVLLAAGRLDLTMGGESVSIVDAPFSKRRTIYGQVERQNLPQVFRTFDFASPDIHTPMRLNTTVPQQALFLMNSPFLVEQAEQLAARDNVAQKATPEERITALYETVFQREPAPEEIALGKHFVTNQQTESPDQFSHPRWQYGYGRLNPETGVLESFTPMPYFTGSAWQGGPTLPDPATDWVSLNANGGHPGPAGFSAVRRWTAPYDGTIAMDGELKHGSAEGDGVLGYAVASNGQVLWRGSAHNNSTASAIERYDVKAGDTIDLVVDCGVNTSFDSFTWHPRFRVLASANDNNATREREWQSQLDFQGPPPPPIEPWGKYAQVLLMSNEFMFVD